MADRTGFGIVGCGLVSQFHGAAIKSGGRQVPAACTPTTAATKESAGQLRRATQLTRLAAILLGLMLGGRPRKFWYSSMPGRVPPFDRICSR